MLFYDVEEAKRELTYLFGVIDMFNMSDAEKKEILRRDNAILDFIGEGC